MRQLPIGVLLSLALHVLVAIGVNWWGSKPPTPVVEERSTVVWLTARSLPPVPEPPEPASPEPEPIEPAAPADGAAPAADPVERAGPTDRFADTDDPATLSTEPPSAPSPGRLVELTDATRRAIDAVLTKRELESSYRSFTFPGTVGEQQAFAEAERHRRVEAGLQAPLTAFDSPSKGREGIEYATPSGQYIRWVSDDCYQTFGAPHPFLLVEPPPITNCVSPLPRADLFENAKPAYLMGEDERRERDERLQRLERLRRPTTGVAVRTDDP